LSMTAVPTSLQLPFSSMANPWPLPCSPLELPVVRSVSTTRAGALYTGPAVKKNSAMNLSSTYK
ncbi:hypothetical protein SELMODRAFT_107248, partial [Selaginella moellendorffii]